MDPLDQLLLEQHPSTRAPPAPPGNASSRRPPPVRPVCSNATQDGADGPTGAEGPWGVATRVRRDRVAADSAH